MRVRIKVYDDCKYGERSNCVAESRYDILDYEIVHKTNEEIFDAGFDTVDPYHEYLILTFEDGTTSTFRNSYVDMFREG